MAFTSIQAAYLDAANWQQHEVNNFKVFFEFGSSFCYFVQKEK
jgi:hypothetical protein